MEKMVKIFVCFHDENKIDEIHNNIKNDDMYVPLFLTNKNHDSHGFFSDLNGDNISDVNPYFSELTGLYWICKNTDEDIVGLCHYRRYFITHKYGGRLLNKDDVLKYLQNNDIILFNGTEPLMGSNYETYESLNESFDLAYKFIQDNCPEYIDAFNKVINEEYPIAFFNMFVCSKNIIDDYCDWVFPILFDLLPKVDLSDEIRLLSVTVEFLFNIYICHKNLKIKELPIRFTERKIKIRMLFTKNKLLRILYKHFYYPLISTIKQ